VADATPVRPLATLTFMFVLICCEFCIFVEIPVVTRSASQWRLGSQREQLLKLRSRPSGFTDRHTGTAALAAHRRRSTDDTLQDHTSGNPRSRRRKLQPSPHSASPHRHKKNDRRPKPDLFWRINIPRTKYNHRTVLYHLSSRRLTRYAPSRPEILSPKSNLSPPKREITVNERGPTHRSLTCLQRKLSQKIPRPTIRTRQEWPEHDLRQHHCVAPRFHTLTASSHTIVNPQYSLASITTSGF